MYTLTTEKNFIEISDSLISNELRHYFEILFTQDVLNFLIEIFTVFDDRISQMYTDRYIRKYRIRKSESLPEFFYSEQRNDNRWRVRPVSERLKNRHLDLGDVSPANVEHFLGALNANVQGIQVDFDDGHCPTWKNQIVGYYNIYSVVHNKNPKAKPLQQLPILMLRPRAWNMIEHNIMVNGKEFPGALVDFAILMYHNAYALYKNECGPCFYLSKLESAAEAKLWNDIFEWTQNRLSIPYGTIKACVLIENILASFEMEEILYELRDHSLGLNCGIWDYSASIITKFGHRKDFVLPDRNKYVTMQKHFLKKYMQLVVQVCHSRNTYATGGMAAQIIQCHNINKGVETVTAAKRFEIEQGIDGFMVYDIRLVPHMNKLWEKMCNNSDFSVDKNVICESDLLQMPTGGVTKNGLIHNIEVSVLFIYNWLQGNGHFIFKGAVEDSATAEISRLQIWQWIKHMVKLEEDNETITFGLIRNLTKDFVTSSKDFNRKILIASTNIFFDIVKCTELPDFITTYLNDHYVFRQMQKTLPSEVVQHKL